MSSSPSRFGIAGESGGQFLLGDLHFVLRFQHQIRLLGIALVGRGSVRRLRLAWKLGQLAFPEALAHRRLEIRQFAHFGSGFVLTHRLLVVLALRGRGNRTLAIDLHRSEEGLKTVVIALGERLELMIVAARAAHGQAKKSQRGGIGNIVERVVAALFLVGTVHHIRAEKIEAGGRERLGVAGPEFVAGDLLADKTVVRLIVIEGANNVVPVTPRMRAYGIVLKAIGLGEAGEVEPVPPPALTISRGGEQAVDELFVGLRGRFTRKLLDLFRRRREAS